MTRLLVDPTTDFDDAGTGPITLTATLLDPTPATVRTFTVTDTATVVDLPAPAASAAWRLTVRRPVTRTNRWNIVQTDPGPIVAERTVHWAGPADVPWAALTDVDPGTLQTTAVPGPAWDAAITALQAEIDALPTGGGGGGGTVVSVNAKTGAVVLGATDVGADPAGAAATAQAFTIQRANHTGTQSADTLTDGTTGKVYTGAERTKLAGIAPGATVNRADTATDAAISTAVGALIGGASAAYDTLGELAAALTADEGTAATLAALVGTKAPLASPAFTGTPTISGTPIAKTSDVSASAATQAASNATIYTVQQWDQSQTLSPAATGLKPYGTVLTVSGSGFDAGYVEAPCVFLDPATGRLVMTYTAYTGPGAAGTASIGYAYSDNGYTWTKAGQLFGGSGFTGDPDFAGTTGSNVVIDGFGVYHLFYIGLDQVGYEAGRKTICHATATALAGPWTRHGAIIQPDGIPGSWREKSVWHPNLVRNRDTWYLFFNATGAIGGADSERAGYATATDLAGSWTVHDADAPLLPPIAVDDRIVTGDPFVSREGDHWRMDFSRADVNWNPVGDYWATTTDAAFPTGWVVRGRSTVFGQPGQGFKPWIFRLAGVPLHYSTTYGGIVLATGQDQTNVDTYVPGRWRFDSPTPVGNTASMVVGDDIGVWTGADKKKLTIGGAAVTSELHVGQASDRCILFAWQYSADPTGAASILETYGGSNPLRIQNNGGDLLLGGAGGKVGLYGATPIARQTGTPVAATDLASALTLVNDLRAKLLAVGIIA